MLEVRDMSVKYGDAQVLWDVSLEVGERQVVAVMGPNGSGKSTILKAIMGLVPLSSGSVTFEGNDITGMPAHELCARGISLVLERRRLFATMTVQENIMLGAYHKSARAKAAERLRWVEGLFPILGERRSQIAGRLSGGEQQMVAIARGLMAGPRLLMMDEPFLGLSPRMVDVIIALVKTINNEGIAVLFNEQNVNLSFSNSDRGYLLESGRMVLSGSGMAMLAHETVRRVYLGH